MRLVWLIFFGLVPLTYVIANVCIDFYQIIYLSNSFFSIHLWTHRQPSGFRQVCGQATICTTSPEAWPGSMIPRLNFPLTTTFHLLNCASSSDLLARTSLATFTYKLWVPRLYILSSIVVSTAGPVSDVVRGSLLYQEQACKHTVTGKVSTLLRITRIIPRQELASLVTTKTIATL